MTFWVSLGAAAVAFAAYAVTASRTITWWDGSSYPLAACTLGITAAPGSLLLTLLGWLASRALVVHPVAFQLNLLAGLIAAATVGLVTRLAIVLSTPGGRPPGPREAIAGLLAGLTLAFSVGMWSHAVQFTPYILTALFTALILTVAMEWWRRARTSDAAIWLFLLFLLFGLDVSVHRTNLLLLPAALVWVTLGRASVWRSPAAWTAALGGLALGLGFHLLLIPMARRDPLFNIDDPRDLRSLWSYVSLERVGGGFLIRLFPRTADFVRVQLADYADFMRRNLWPALPAYGGLLLGLVGWFAALRHTPRGGLGMLAFYLSASLGAVIYFNLPDNYFRDMDRHYLPSLVVFVPLIGLGAATVMRLIAGAGVGVRQGLAIALGALLLLVPAGEWAVNRATCDLSRVRFAETRSRDVLETLPEDAILLTNGDNDSFPLWYLQQVEGVRRDVIVMNLPMLNTRTYLGQLRRHHEFLAQLLPGEQGAGYLVAVQAGDSLVTVPVPLHGALGLPESATASITIPVKGELYGQDRVVLDLLRLNRWRRPLFLACTVTQDNVSWLWPYARLEGLSFRIVPSKDPSVGDLRRLRHVLMEEVRYTDVADSTIRMDSDTRGLCANYAYALIQLATLELAKGNPQRCLETLRLLEEKTPPKRVGMPDALLDPMRKQAEAALRQVAAAADTSGSAPTN